MSKGWIACVSFLAGAVVSAAFGFQHPGPATTAPPKSYATQTVSDFTPDGLPRRTLISGVAFQGDRNNIGDLLWLHAEPRVLDINTLGIEREVTFANGRLSLDGLDCRDCSFSNMWLVYGGGPLNLENASFSDGVTISYTGAAANALAMEGLVRDLQRGVKHVPAIRGAKPSASIKRTTPKRLFDFSAPFITSN